MRGLGEGAGLRFDALEHEVFDLGPQARIAFALHVAVDEGAVEPGIADALDRRLVVVEAEITENLSASRIGRGNLMEPVDESVGLVKVGGGGDVIGNDAIVLPKLVDAIDLHGQQDGDALAIQFAGEHDNRGRSPTLTVKDDARLSLFVVAKDAVVIAVEQAEDGAIRGFSVTVFENLHVCAFGSHALEAFGKLYRAMVGIVVADESTDKTDDDGRRRFL